MGWRLLGALPLFTPLLAYYCLAIWHQIAMKFKPEIPKYSLNKVNFNMSSTKPLVIFSAQMCFIGVNYLPGKIKPISSAVPICISLINVCIKTLQSKLIQFQTLYCHELHGIKGFAFTTSHYPLRYTTPERIKGIGLGVYVSPSVIIISKSMSINSKSCCIRGILLFCTISNHPM